MIKLLDLVEAKQVGTLYHFTKFKGILGILKTNSLKIGDDSTFKSGGNLGNISLTRDKNLSYWFLPYRITLDGDKLSDNYKVTPHSWSKGGKGGESEESINKTIKNLSEYIIDIHYILTNRDQPSNLEELDKVIEIYPNIKFIYKNKEVDYNFVKNFLEEFPQETSLSKFSKTYQYKNKIWILTQSKNIENEPPFNYSYTVTVDGKIYNLKGSSVQVKDYDKYNPIKGIFNDILKNIS